MILANTVVEIISALFIGTYVVITAKTLQQLVEQTKLFKNQTILLSNQLQLQFDAHLKMVGFSRPNIDDQNSTEKIVKYPLSLSFQHPGERTDYLDEELEDKVKKITRPIFNFNDEDVKPFYFIVSLTNYGSTNVERVSLEVTVKVQYVPRELYKNFPDKEFEEKVLHIPVNEIIERNGGKVIVPIINVLYFPSYSIDVIGKYSDIRGKNYTLQPISLFGGTSFQNLINFPNAISA